MRIAICLSGQPRSWERCLPRWREMFKDHEVDFFFHLWDYNTLPRILESYNGGMELIDELITPLEKLKIIGALKPLKFVFESKKDIQCWNSTIPEELQFASWAASQFYSMYKVSLLKREYEIEHNFRYDAVFRFRSDLYFTVLPVFTKPLPNTAYTVHNKWDEKYQCQRVGDIFYYADSHTFDQLSAFFKYLAFIQTDWVTSVSGPPPELALYNYIANIGIHNFATHIDIKLMRTQEYVDIRGLADYETI